MSKSSVFWQAFKESPRLYFAPAVAMAKALVDAQMHIQDEMLKTTSGAIEPDNLGRVAKKSRSAEAKR